MEVYTYLHERSDSSQNMASREIWFFITVVLCELYSKIKSSDTDKEKEKQELLLL